MSNSSSHFLWGINTYSTNFNDHSYFYFSNLNIFLSTLGGERGSTFHPAIPQIFCCLLWALQEDFAAWQAGSTKDSRAALLKSSTVCCLLLNYSSNHIQVSSILCPCRTVVDLSGIPQPCQPSPHCFNCRMRLLRQSGFSKRDLRWTPTLLLLACGFLTCRKLYIVLKSSESPDILQGHFCSFKAQNLYLLTDGM